MKLPAIVFWFEPIDSVMLCGHAMRAWERPSNGVFVLIQRENYRSWDDVQGVKRILEQKLRQREAGMMKKLGQHRWHLMFEREGWDRAIAFNGTPGTESLALGWGVEDDVVEITRAWQRFAAERNLEVPQ